MRNQLIRGPNGYYYILNVHVFLCDIFVIILLTLRCAPDDFKLWSNCIPSELISRLGVFEF